MKYAAEFRDLAVRSVNDARAKYPTRRAMIVALSKPLGIPPETLQRWVRRAERDVRRRTRPTPTEAKTRSPDDSPARSASAAAGGHVFLSYSRVDREYVSRLAGGPRHRRLVRPRHRLRRPLGNGDPTAAGQRLGRPGRDVHGGPPFELGRSRSRSGEAAADAGPSGPDRVRRHRRGCRRAPVRQRHGRSDARLGLLPEAPGFPRLRARPGQRVERGATRRGETHRICDRPAATRVEGTSRCCATGELLRVGLDPGPVNGVFGTRVAAAVREFQRRRCHVPTANGVVGPLTWAILANSSLGDLAPPASSATHGETPPTE